MVSTIDVSGCIGVSIVHGMHDVHDVHELNVGCHGAD